MVSGEGAVMDTRTPAHLWALGDKIRPSLTSEEWAIFLLTVAAYDREQQRAAAPIEPATPRERLIFELGAKEAREQRAGQVCGTCKEWRRNHLPFTRYGFCTRTAKPELDTHSCAAWTLKEGASDG